MKLIADAAQNHDAAALKKLFSQRARQKAADLDGGLKYFLSAYPSGHFQLADTRQWVGRIQ